MTKKEQARIVAELARPDTYALRRLGMKLHPTQAQVLRALFKSKSRVVFRCANECGKTRRVVTSAVLFASEILGAMVVSTAGVFRQVSEQLIPALKAHAHLFDQRLWTFNEAGIKKFDVKKKCWLDAYSGVATTDEHRFQGYHMDDGTPLLMIVDEAQGVPDDILRAAEDRCNPTFFLVCGSPGDPAGGFYDMETKLSAHYQHFKLSRPECTREKGWWLEQSDIDRMVAKYGADNPFIRSTVFGEFSDIVEGALLSLGEFDRCVENPPLKSGRDIHAFCDFAAGRDKNVLAVRVGNRVWIEKKWQDRDTMAGVGEFVALFNKLKREYGLKPEDISGDADGLGLPMVHRLKETGWPINEFHGGSTPRFEDGYRNAVAEGWGELSAKIKRKEIILPSDADFKAQILGRKCKRNSSGKLELESKEDMRKRGLGSPDEADAIAGCSMPSVRAQSFNFIEVPSRHEEVQQQETGERRYFT